MHWSQLRKRLLDRVAGSIQSRIDIHQTRYRNAHDQEGEIWLTVDKERIFSSGSASYLSKLGEVVDEIHADGATWPEAYGRAWPVMESSGFMLLEAINKDLFNSLNQSIGEMMEQKNPLIRGLTIVDSRFGKRRLAAFDASSEHDLVKRLFILRCEAEGIKISNIQLNPDSPAAS
jgi:hypothetical protein